MRAQWKRRPSSNLPQAQGMELRRMSIKQLRAVADLLLLEVPEASGKEKMTWTKHQVKTFTRTALEMHIWAYLQDCTLA